MKNGILVKSLALTSAVLLLFACGKKDPAAQLAALKEQKAKIEAQIAELEKAAPPTEAPRKIRNVGVTEVAITNFRHYIDLQGKVDAEDNVPVTAKMPGTLTRIFVQNGSQVRQGQLLAQLDDQLLQKSMDQLDVQLATAKDIYDRQKGLWDQKIGTEIPEREKAVVSRSAAVPFFKADQPPNKTPIYFLSTSCSTIEKFSDKRKKYLILV